MIYDSNDTNFAHKLLLNNRQVSKLYKTFANNSSANVKSSKNQLSKIAEEYSEEIITTLSTSGNSFASKLAFIYNSKRKIWLSIFYS